MQHHHPRRPVFVTFTGVLVYKSDAEGLASHAIIYIHILSQDKFTAQLAYTMCDQLMVLYHNFIQQFIAPCSSVSYSLQGCLVG
jgi:hypothetical protein